MAASSKEEVLAQAKTSFKTLEVGVGTAKVEFRELSHAERKALDESNYQVKDGELVQDAEGYLVPVVEKHPRYMERWIAATISPTLTVDEVYPLPLSLKREWSLAAKKINGIEPASETAKN